MSSDFNVRLTGDLNVNINAGSIPDAAPLSGAPVENMTNPAAAPQAALAIGDPVVTKKDATRPGTSGTVKAIYGDFIEIDRGEEGTLFEKAGEVVRAYPDVTPSVGDLAVVADECDDAIPGTVVTIKGFDDDAVWVDLPGGDTVNLYPHDLVSITPEKVKPPEEVKPTEETAKQAESAPEGGGTFTTYRQATSAFDEPVTICVPVRSVNRGRNTVVADVRRDFGDQLGINIGNFMPYVNGQVRQDSYEIPAGQELVWMPQTKDRGQR